MRVIVTIDKKGTPKVEASGVSGSGCQDLTRAMQDALGRDGETTRKPEFFEQQAQQVAQAR
jgi:hypothetical protein